MTRIDPIFAIIALLLLVGGTIGAALAGESSVVAAITLLTGLLTALFAVISRRRDEESVAAPPPPIALSSLPPGIDELIEAVDDPMLLVEGRLVKHANAAARTLLGAHIVGEDIRLAIRHPAAAERLTGRTSSSEAAWRIAIDVVGVGERERQWQLVMHQLRGGNRLVRLVDRTATYATERMRVDFVANASHELRTPLATLLGFIETLEDGKAGNDEVTRARFLKIMFREAKRMQQLVDDLMSLSRIEAEKYSVPHDPQALLPLAQEVRDSMRASRQDVDERVRIDAAPHTADVIGDRAQLSQLLYNLIGNALKYGRPGTPVRVSLDTAPSGMVRLTVADQGEGVAPEHLPRLTERFYRVDAGRSRSLGGTGLGLAIVKHIVERHRGRLDIDSVVGEGTTVTVLLPAAPASSSNRNANATETNRNGLSGIAGTA
ncbi:ATP-binding protein [Flavisphingomonas formosensis]|uniref:ATP-binding protein n=1 Tax=Flavisphingomonas formosensis TaxID=861534 RepID=UPI0012FCA0B3|nr:ATP-binding protein [Sphingomonas formosensis]